MAWIIFWDLALFSLLCRSSSSVSFSVPKRSIKSSRTRTSSTCSVVSAPFLCTQNSPSTILCSISAQQSTSNANFNSRVRHFVYLTEASEIARIHVGASFLVQNVKQLPLRYERRRRTVHTMSKHTCTLWAAFLCYSAVCGTSDWWVGCSHRTIPVAGRSLLQCHGH